MLSCKVSLQGWTHMVTYDQCCGLYIHTHMHASMHTHKHGRARNTHRYIQIHTHTSVQQHQHAQTQTYSINNAFTSKVPSLSIPVYLTGLNSSVTCQVLRICYQPLQHHITEQVLDNNAHLSFNSWRMSIICLKQWNICTIQLHAMIHSLTQYTHEPL